MQSIRLKNGSGLFFGGQSKISIFSGERLVRFINVNADVFESLARMSMPYGGNVSARA